MESVTTNDKQQASRFNDPWRSWLYEGGKFVRWVADPGGKPEPVWKQHHDRN